MKLLNLASNNSFWRGIDYHHENRIISWKELAENCYQGKVRGSGNTVYDVTIDTRIRESLLVTVCLQKDVELSVST